MAVAWPFHGHSMAIPSLPSSPQEVRMAAERTDAFVIAAQSNKHLESPGLFLTTGGGSASRTRREAGKLGGQKSIEIVCPAFLLSSSSNICGGESRRQKDLPPMTEGENWPRTVSCCVADFCSFPCAPSVLSSDSLSQDKFSVPSQENFASRRPKSHEGSAGDLQT